MAANNPEVWLPVVGYEGLYEVSDYGRVRSLLSGISTIMKGGRTQCPMGYWRVTLSGASKRTRNVHILVLEAFEGLRPSGKHGLHHDGIQLNNRLSNLYWGSPAENSLDRIRHGRSGRGSCNPRAKLTSDQVESIRFLVIAGVRQVDLAGKFGVTQTQISRIARAESWRALIMHGENTHG